MRSRPPEVREPVVAAGNENMSSKSEAKMYVPNLGKFPDPYFGTVVCVRLNGRDESHVWWPAVVETEPGVPFAWGLEAGRWASADGEDVKNVEEDELLVNVRYFKDTGPELWPSVINLQDCTVKPFAHTLLEFYPYEMVMPMVRRRRIYERGEL